MENIKEEKLEFKLNSLFDPRYYNIIIANDDLKEWFRVNQDTLVKIGCTSLESAREILESENQEILDNKLIQEYATIASEIFRVFDIYVDKNIDFRGLSCVSYNVMFSVNLKHEEFKNYKPEDMIIRKYDFDMITSILSAVHNSKGYNIVHDCQTTSWEGSISDSLTFKVQSHEMYNGFEDPDWSKVVLKLDNEILTIETYYENRIPSDSSNVIVRGASSDLIEKVYNELHTLKLK